MMWTAIGCLIGGVVVLVLSFVLDSATVTDKEKRRKFVKIRPYIQIVYLLLFIAAAVLFLIW